MECEEKKAEVHLNKEEFEGITQKFAGINGTESNEVDRGLRKMVLLP